MEELRPTITEHNFDCLEEFAESMGTRGVDMEVYQRRPGPSGVSVHTSDFGVVRITRFRFGTPAIRRGAQPKDKVWFWLRSDPVANYGYWCGQPLEGTGVSVFPNEFCASGNDLLDATTIEVDRDYLAEVAGLCELEPQNGAPHDPVSVSFSAARLYSFSGLVRALEIGQVEDPRHGLVDLSRELLAVTKGEACRPKPRLAARQRAFNAARQYIEDYAGDALRTTDLCRATGVSQRTLEYAFRTYADTTPKAYLKIVRLHRVRSMLRTDMPAIADVANRWGFWHMGQFARDYRALFGVNPSVDASML